MRRDLTTRILFWKRETDSRLADSWRVLLYPVLVFFSSGEVTDSFRVG